MGLELLANEILLELFGYVPVVDLFHSFHDLNSRFNHLLSISFHDYRLDFRSMSKRNFDKICRDYLPLIMDRIISLRLSDDDETPGQIKCFLSHNLILRKFTNLRSLSLSNLRSSTAVSKIMFECHHLHQLTHLKFTKCEFGNDYVGLRQIFNNIWSLPKITHCYLDVTFHGESYFVVPSMISTTIQYLTIEGVSYTTNQVATLLQCTPRLQYLCMSPRDDSDDQMIPFTIPSMITLKVGMYETSATMRNILQNMPNLCHLTVDAEDVNMNGHDWEQIIVDHLPKLTTFHLRMKFNVDNNVNLEERADELIDSFQTRFWLHERHWFVRCEVDICDCECDRKRIFLYTLPVTFYSHELCISNIKPRSTFCDTNDSLLRNHAHCLYFGHSPSICLSSQLCFSNVRRLVFSLPVNENLMHIIPNFNQLVTLDVSILNEVDDFDPQSQLQPLLDKASGLRSLTFSRWPLSSKQMPPFEYSCKSVCQLDLQGSVRCYNRQQCITLSRSLLGIQCEILSITVETRENVIELIKNMSHLRALNVICLDDTLDVHDDDQPIVIKDELIEWLQFRLPSTYTISRNDDTVIQIPSNFICFKPIRLWIG